MSEDPRSLRGLNRWLVLPLLWNGAFALAGLAAYSLFAFQLPTGTLTQFVGAAAVIVLLAELLLDAAVQRTLRTVRGLGTGELAATRQNLQAAMREVTAAPDRAFWNHVLVWLLGTFSAGVAVVVLAHSTWEVGARVFVVGSLFGSSGVLLAHLAIVRRSRRCVERLAGAGLSPPEAIAAVPPTRRRMRARLVTFTLFLVLAPGAIIVELGFHTAGQALDRTLAASRGERDAEQARLPAQQLECLAVLALFTVVVGALAVRAVGNALTEPTRAISEQARRIAEGDLSAGALVPAEDELWVASAAFATMHAHLATALGQLHRAGLRISSTTEQIVEMSSRHQTGAGEQVAALNETMATTEELARSARQIADNAGAVATMAEQTLAAARAGRRNAETFAQSMARMRKDNQGIADSVVRLNKRVQQIGKIVEFINGIADKSDLLALNAELEGTKAGEVGRGFSLVAAEMRRVAENVLSSTRQIARLIDDIRDATNAAVMATEAGVKATDSGSVHSSQLAERLRVILELANSTADAIRAISLATQQQQAGTDQLALAMAGVLQVTQQGAESTRQLGSANGDLVALAKDLKSAVQRFKVA
jgi:methyl-accepting chemotaxis protein